MGGSADDRYERTALLEFPQHRSVKLGLPSEVEVRSHRLWGRGLPAHGAFIVRNSTWIAELKGLSTAHAPDPATHEWEGLSHYRLTFHDSTFERIAARLAVRTLHPSMSQSVYRKREKGIKFRYGTPTLPQ
jgi:hypothetical protein